MPKTTGAEQIRVSDGEGVNSDLMFSLKYSKKLSRMPQMLEKASTFEHMGELMTLLMVLIITLGLWQCLLMTLE